MDFPYDKQPCVAAKGFGNDHAFAGYDAIAKELARHFRNQKKKILVIDCYPGVRVQELKEGLIDKLPASLVVYSDEEAFEAPAFVNETIRDHMTDDRVFGIMTHFRLEMFLDQAKTAQLRQRILDTDGLIVIYGVGASLVCAPDVYVYADLARWEIQQRYRSGETPNWKCDNHTEDPLRKFKRGYFFEWRIADEHKQAHFDRWDYLLDTNQKDCPKMITAQSYWCALEAATKSPFRVVPYFDPGVWGGQWMKTTFALEQDRPNYAWAFDCVPEENSLLVRVGDLIVETPAINLVLRYPRALLGEKVFAMFGAEFPIRFDFLDTYEGQNLSLQVHPLKDYIYRNFGMPYTQDESYYILEAKEDAHVYLGVQTGLDREAFLSDLKKSEAGEIRFPAGKYINDFPAKKHDHFLIPAGTIHCSGSNTVVLEISATPYIFTFKLWDWGRLGLDGRPRPVHIEHGSHVIQYERDTEWVRENLVNRIVPIASGDGWREERTGLHELEPIETRRHWFTKPVLHDTQGTVNVLNLVQGRQCIVESPTGAFAPFLVHYAETFIVPASVGPYQIRPYGVPEGEELATVKAFVRGS
ncbi:MAG: class I mannose-6-phosphate isomerase [Gemmiger sp.]